MPGRFRRWMRRPAETFRIPHFPAFWAANILQFFSFQMNVIANQWLVTTITPSRTLLGLVGFVQGGVISLTSPVAGVVVDRFPKRNLLIAGRLVFAGAVSAITVLVWLDAVHIWQILAISMVVGLTQAMMQPATQTFVFDIVGRERVQNAVALNSIGTGLSQMGGPALAGALIAVAGVLAAFVSAAAGLVFACLMLFLIPIRGAPVAGNTVSAWRQLGEGLAYARSNRPLMLVLLSSTAAIFNGSLFAMRPIFARHVLGVGSVGYGVMAAFGGAGAITGAIVIAAMPPARRPGVLTVSSMLAFGTCLLLYSFAFSYAYILAVEFLVGVASQFWQVSVFSGLQMSVPEAMRGRMIALVFTCVQLSFVGQLLVGILADQTSDQVALGLFGAIPMILLGTMLIFGFRTLSKLRLLESEPPPASA